MRRLITVLVFIALIAIPALAEQPERMNIVATNFPCYDFVRTLIGELADVRMLLLPGSESHSYEPTPQDILAIQNADVFVYVGGESDEWVRDVLDSMDTSGMKIVALMDCVQAVEEETVEGMQAEDEHEHEDEPEYDEHVWTAPLNVVQIMRHIADALCEADPSNEDVYRAKADEYIVQLDALDSALRDVVAGGVRNTIVFGDRFPFRYLADAYGLNYFAAFPGCATETEPSAKTVAFLIDKVSAEQIPVVFHMELSNEKMANTICEETGAKKLLLHACHNIARDDFEAGETYLSLMARNVEALREALS